jgi:hypothetical protein
MPDSRLDEAARIFAEIGAYLPDSQAFARGRRRLAEALEAAEKRGQRAAAEKQQSG